MKVRQLLCVLVLICAHLATVQADIVPARPDTTAVQNVNDVHPVTFFALARNTYNDNIYNLPADMSVEGLHSGAGAARADWIQTGAVGMQGDWQIGAQELIASLQADYNRFRHNDSLNNAASDDKLEWNWRVGPQLSGRLYGTYEQGLAGFANTRFYSKDVLRTTTLYGEADWQLGPHWIAKGNARRVTTTHGADQRIANDFRSDAGTVGLDCLTDEQNLLGWEYRRLRGSFPHAPADSPLLADRAYTEDSGNFHADYHLTGKTTFEGRVGYLRRRYSSEAAANRVGDFSGTVWRASFIWQASAKTRLTLSGSRDLTAYIDAQSDYFVSTGASVTALWSTTETLDVSVMVSRERDAYVGANPELAFNATRRDWITGAQGLVTWTPRRYFSMELAYRFTNRNSTVDTFDYRYNTIALELRLTL